MKSLFTKALLLMLSLCLMSFMTVAQGTIKGKIVISVPLKWDELNN